MNDRHPHHKEREDRTRRTHVRFLQLAGVSQAAGEVFDVDAVCKELGMSSGDFKEVSHELESTGLYGFSIEDDGTGPPCLTHAGRQYLKHDGYVLREILNFLPKTIDDLYARRALLLAGTTLVDSFAHSILSEDDRGIAHARQSFVPKAFSEAVDEELVLKLYGAAVALMARLSAEEPAGCVAEEVIAVALLEDAEFWLDHFQGQAHQKLDEEGLRHAQLMLRELFELFQDDDVLDMFDMEEPSDAALAGHSFLNRQMGVADQRIEAWFERMWEAAPTGHLDESQDLLMPFDADIWTK